LAIQTKLKIPNSKITIIEKHKEYKRKHILRIDKSTFIGSHNNDNFQKIIKKFEGFTSTNSIENSLKSFCEEVDIDIVYQTVESCTDLLKKYPNARLFIGADGTHSIVKKELFTKDDYKIKYQNVVEVKYLVSGETRELSNWSEVPSILLNVKYLIFENIGKLKEDQTTPVTMRIFIDEEEYEDVKDATFKNPYKIDEIKKLKKELKDSIFYWIDERKKITGVDYIEESLTMSSLILEVKSNEKIYKKFEYSSVDNDTEFTVVDEKIFLLVGDAAFSVPYFRSLNNGWLCSNFLYRNIDYFFNENDSDVFHDYELFTSTLSKYENFKVFFKNSGIEILKTLFNGKNNISQLSNSILDLF
jgi:hypothetical protein